MKNLKLIALATIFSFTGIIAANAQDATQPKPIKKEFHKNNAERMEKMKAELNLTDEQVEKIKAIHEKNDAEKAAHKDKLKEINQAEHEEIKTVLTEEQKAILRAKREQNQKQQKPRKAQLEAQPADRIAPKQ
ncbi:MAG: Spy/CpxP family protein refolding chaperone [Vicingaceae bacterium]|nr:Spy/CpxP family protein refolding chaperone [Vicingaceae bacterium]